MMNRQYNDDINKIQLKIEEEETNHRIQKMQADHISACIAEMLDIENLDFRDNLIYGELIDRIIINNGRMVDVYLTCADFRIRLVYRTEGKLDAYKVTITSVTVG